ncbi:Uncharacterised protein [Shigella sonnei]|nr:Uncharacterised protein [Shigella sonnei]
MQPLRRKIEPTGTYQRGIARYALPSLTTINLFRGVSATLVGLLRLMGILQPGVNIQFPQTP